VLFQSYVFLQPKNEIKEGFNILLYKNGITCMKKHVDAKHLEF
jgi:predicted small secreted protein